MKTILVIDDDDSIIKCFIELFKDEYVVKTAYNSVEAMNIIELFEIDMVYIDYRLPGENGIEILKKIRFIIPGISVILMTAYGNMQTIIDAISNGATDYIEKPLDIDKLTELTKRILDSKKISEYVKYLYDENIENYKFDRIIGKSEKMQEVFKQIGRLVTNQVQVLIIGESGVGKELISKALHYNSINGKEPFMAINCSGLSEQLLDNELFGHEAQAFTGAITRRIGKFEAAGDGTVFLDEIGDMPLSIQAKFLRVLQEREFQRLGGNKTIKLNSRIILATNKNLDKEVEAGNFRRDLYYRITVAKIQSPPLRESIEKISGITNEALNILKNYRWTGNVRELENVILNICINLQSNIIDVQDIPLNIKFDFKPNNDFIDEFVEEFISKYKDKSNIYHLLIDEIESRLFDKIGKLNNYNKTAMAKVLGVSRITLNKKNIQSNNGIN